MVVTEAPARRHVRRVPAVVGAAVVVLVLVAGAVALRPPDAWHAGGDGIGVSQGRVGVPVVAVVAFPARAVDVVAARPVLARRSADATVTLRTCHQRGVGDRIGAGGIRTLELCDSVEPLVGSHLEAHPPKELYDDYVVAVITPLERGVVRMTGMAVTSRRAWLHRTERTGSTIEVTVR